MREALQLFFQNNFSSTHWHLDQLWQQRILIWPQLIVSKVQDEDQKNEIEDLRRQLAEAKESCVLAQANREISFILLHFVYQRN